MSATLAPAVSVAFTESQALAALRSVLIAILPTGLKIVRSQGNRVAEPADKDFVVFTPILRRRLGTNLISYSDPVVLGLTGPGTRSATEPTELTVQLDIHGPNSGDNAQVVATLLRDAYACDLFKALGVPVQPLYTSEPRETPFINEGRQYEYRWTVDVVLHANLAVVTAQDFFDQAQIGLINVDVVYPPGTPVIQPAAPSRASASSTTEPQFSQGGIASIQFTGGAVVEDGIEFLIPAAPYPLQITRLDYEVGTAGGSFTVAAMNGGNPVGGLSVSVSNTTTASATATSNAFVPVNGRVTAVISGTVGEPTEAVLTLHFLH